MKPIENGCLVMVKETCFRGNSSNPIHADFVGKTGTVLNCNVGRTNILDGAQILVLTDIHELPFAISLLMRIDDPDMVDEEFELEELTA